MPISAHESNSPPSETRDQCTHKPKRDAFDKVKFVMELVALAALIVYTTFAALQWCAMSKTLDTMKTQFAKEQRPWVWFKPKEVKFVDNWQKLNTVPFKWGISATNYGKSPAVNACFCSMLWVWDDPASLKTQLTRDRILSACGGPNNANAIRTVIPPGDEVTTTKTPNHGYNAEALKFLKNTDDVMAVTGYVSYEDLDGSKYLSIFCGERFAAGGIHVCGPNIDKVE